jgi:NifU-like protein involved in Fe-S cluster formation
MSADPYSARVRALFAGPAHAGTLAAAQRVYVAEQGVRIELSATLRKGSIHSLRFRAWGCPHVIAATELLCAQFEGRSAAAQAAVKAADLMQSLAVPVTKSGRILVVEDAARALGAALRETSAITGQFTE